MNVLERLLDGSVLGETKVLRADEDEPDLGPTHRENIFGEKGRQHAEVGDAIQTIKESDHLSTEYRLDLEQRFRQHPHVLRKLGLLQDPIYPVGIVTVLRMICVRVPVSLRDRRNMTGRLRDVRLDGEPLALGTLKLGASLHASQCEQYPRLELVEPLTAGHVDPDGA